MLDNEKLMQKIDISNLSEGDYIVVKYEDVFYPGMVIKLDRLKKDFSVKRMSKAGKYWTWSTNDDVSTYSEKYLICAIVRPKMVTARGFSIYSISRKKVLNSQSVLS
ncbi:hypothetical protein JTB14_020869 [Gonioctena quinquepunctata]|nr:hypothetical protein JTB14_020869 [Gonioctena quinquepunctata]